MSWTTNQVLTALTVKLRATAPDTTAVVQHIEVSPTTAAPGTGIAHVDTRVHTSGGTSDPATSSLVLQELVELHQSLNANEPSVAIVNGADWWWSVIEVQGVPGQSGNINLRWLEDDGANPTQNANKSVAPGADTEATARNILTQLETIPHATDAGLRVVNGRGAFFYGWVVQGGSSNLWSVVLVASSHRQRYARVVESMQSVQAQYTYGGADGRMLVTHLEDPGAPWDAAMLASQIAAVAETNAQGGSTSVIPTRDDLTIQGTTHRAATAAKMRTVDKVTHAEIIAPAVPRTVVIPIAYSDFSAVSGTITRSINLPWPFNDRLGFDYYAEGTPVILDAFLELGTPWQVASGSGQAGVYPSVVMDIGLSAPVLPDASYSGRLTTSALLRGIRLTENATQNYNLGGGYAPVNQVYAPSGEHHQGAVAANHAGNADEWVHWGDTDRNTQAAVPYIEASEDMALRLIAFQPQEAYAPDSSNYTTFKIYVCPKDTAPASQSFVALNTYFDITAAPYSMPSAWSSAGVYTPTAAVSGEMQESYLPIRIPKGWKLAVEQIQVGHGGLSDMRSWTVQILTAAHRGRGMLLTPGSMPVVDPFSDRSDNLTATISLEAQTELQVGDGITEPGGTTYNLASLDQGQCYLHVRFWQPRRVGSQRSYATETS